MTSIDLVITRPSVKLQWTSPPDLVLMTLVNGFLKSSITQFVLNNEGPFILKSFWHFESRWFGTLI